jgi:hypothetical protein
MRRYANAIRSLRVFPLLGVFAIVGMLMSCQDRPTSLNVPLDYKPTTAADLSVTLPVGQGKLYVLPVDDQRTVTDKKQIGENREKPVTVPIMAGDLSAADWVHDSFSDILRRNGLTVVNNADGADLLMNISLTEFWAQEDPTYNARISALLKVSDKTGKVLWSGLIAGNADFVGGSLDAQHYDEVFSNAMFNATNRLINNASFQQALVPPAAPSEATPPPPPPH